MTKLELIDRIYRKRGVSNGMTKKAVAEIVDGVFAELGDYFVTTKVPARGPGPNGKGGTRRPASLLRFPLPIHLPSTSAVT